MDCDIFNPTKDKPTNIVSDCVALQLLRWPFCSFFFLDICKIFWVHLSVWSPIDLHLRLGLYTILVNPKGMQWNGIQREKPQISGEKSSMVIDLIGGYTVQWLWAADSDRLCGVFSSQVVDLGFHFFGLIKKISLTLSCDGWCFHTRTLDETHHKSACLRHIGNENDWYKTRSVAWMCPNLQFNQ